jgi:hypothetical protein
LRASAQSSDQTEHHASHPAQACIEQVSPGGQGCPHCHPGARYLQAEISTTACLLRWPPAEVRCERAVEGERAIIDETEHHHTLWDFFVSRITIKQIETHIHTYTHLPPMPHTPHTHTHPPIHTPAHSPTYGTHPHRHKHRHTRSTDTHRHHTYIILFS